MATNQSILFDDTDHMLIERELAEKKTLRRMTGLPVKSKIDPDDYQPSHGLASGASYDEEYLEDQGVEAHPEFMKNQAMDGRDHTLQVDTRYHPDAKRELDNARNELQRKLRLQKGLDMTPGFNPKPSIG